VIGVLSWENAWLNELADVKIAYTVFPFDPAVA
jgi:hypothetical protein